MASRTVTPTTPAPQTVPSNDATGTWTHPRMTEIQCRLNATAFGERQIRTVARNLVLLTLTVALPALLSLHWLLVSILKAVVDATAPYSTYLIWACRILATINIGFACSPLLRSKDDLSDIPLTPTQRALLGLQPTNKVATPGSQYVTPPRYSRTPTPRSGSEGRSGSPYSDSPLVGHGTAGTVNSYSPSASPLFQKAIGRDVARRLSHGSPGLTAGRASEQSTGSLFSNTPSPVARGRNSSVSLSSRWLFEKSKSGGMSLRSSYN